jgi:hypothetical protein
MKSDGTLAFIDVETTHTHPEIRRAWDVAVILRRPDGEEAAWQWFVSPADLNLGEADERALAIGKFWDRHPWFRGKDTAFSTESHVMREVERLTRGAQLVAWNVGFDAETLDRRMRANGICPTFDYHTIDLHSMTAGCLAGQGRTPAGRWGSQDLPELLGVPEPPDEDRHTALGDARWHMAIYDRITGRTDG